MLKFKNIGILIKRNSKIICSYDTLRAHTFRARHKSLRARYAPDYKCARNFFRPENADHKNSEYEHLFYAVGNTPILYIFQILTVCAEFTDYIFQLFLSGIFP